MEGALLEQHIRERIRGFDIPALLEVLAAAGYGGAEIEYRSHRTTLHQSHLVHDIQFIHQPRKRVIITVNIGLLSAQSPLPSFLMRTMEQLDHERLERFVGFFDHRLLQECFAGLHPERDGGLLPGWPEAARDRLRLLRPECPSTLHWLFNKVFPETEISVRREARKQRLPAREMRLGASALGEGDAMGGFASVATGGIEVRIHCNEPLAHNGVPWAVEARRRFSSDVLPLLTDKVLMLSVILLLREQESVLRIERDSHLGYEPLKVSAAQTQHVVLFSGDTSSPAALVT
ncbi:Type VI secretion, VasB, ImpH, VC_A0111 [Stigmatella aurantiaca]|uniref:Type VI secretion, VasB, ImpH, VC_A0111 n=1 Tax=Stigmatella aurantiaca TaxID=41 RepID=A0A1H7TX23_STIAU|nr:hypothetical protein [Stigmatella aurantiaca]SEL89213.1 Type VI secretion, VasB, ImpH, VC_A0111 [Stigmatella aurantiaca]